MPDPEDLRQRDARLMRRMSRGDAQAYRELSDLYLTKVLNYSYRILGSQAEAEEVTQESFLRLWQSAENWKGNAQVHTWLFRVAHNLSVDHLRKRKHQSSDSEDQGVESAAPSRMLARRRAADAVREALKELPERQHRAVLLSHFEGLKNQEIADALEIGVEAVESLLSRARRRLREILTPHAPNEGE